MLPFFCGNRPGSFGGSGVWTVTPATHLGCQTPVCRAALAALGTDFTHGWQVRELTSFAHQHRNNPEAILIGRPEAIRRQGPNSRFSGDFNGCNRSELLPSLRNSDRL
jgi:hypothetical protein